MGTWGVGLYQDDVACDTKDDYLDLLRIGKSNIEATSLLIDNNSDFINDDEDGPIFWLALADTQWRYGRLLPKVKEEAMRCINEESDLKRWKSNTKLLNKRKQILVELKEKLNSPQPNEKKVKKISIRKPIWNIGDILLYRIHNDELKNSKWYNKYVLFKVVGITTENIGGASSGISHKIDVVSLCNWVSDKKIDLLHKSEIPKNMGNIMFVFCFDKKELKEFNFEVVYKSDSNENCLDHVINPVGIHYPNIYNLDDSLMLCLDKAYLDGTLDEYNK